MSKVWRIWFLKILCRIAVSHKVAQKCCEPLIHPPFSSMYWCVHCCCECLVPTLSQAFCLHYVCICVNWGMCNSKSKTWQVIAACSELWGVLLTQWTFQNVEENTVNYVCFRLCSQEVQHNCQLHRISFCADDKTDKRIFTFICKDSESNKHLCYVFDSEKCVSMPDVLGWFVLFYKPGIVLFPALTEYLEMNKACKHLTAPLIDSSCHENRLQNFILTKCLCSLAKAHMQMSSLRASWLLLSLCIYLEVI